MKYIHSRKAFSVDCVIGLRCSRLHIMNEFECGCFRSSFRPDVRYFLHVECFFCCIVYTMTTIVIICIIDENNARCLWLEYDRNCSMDLPTTYLVGQYSSTIHWMDIQPINDLKTRSFIGLGVFLMIFQNVQRKCRQQREHHTSHTASIANDRSRFYQL